MKRLVLWVLTGIVIVLTFAAIGERDIELEVDESNLEQREEEVKLIDINKGGLPEERDTKKEDIIEDKDKEDKDKEDKGKEDKNKEDNSKGDNSKEDKNKEDKSNKSEETGE